MSSWEALLFSYRANIVQNKLINTKINEKKGREVVDS